jgi:hypothetical protein
MIFRNNGKFTESIEITMITVALKNRNFTVGHLSSTTALASTASFFSKAKFCF